MWLLLTLACASSELPLPLYDLGGEFFDAPWPSFERLGPLGGPSLRGFPNSDTYPLLTEYVELADQVLDGAPTTAPIYFRFDGALDTSALPSAAGSMETDASVFLLDIDPRSPTWGQRVPITWDFQEERTEYQPTNLLAIAPLAGATLRPGTEYAAVVTTTVAARHPRFEDAWRGSTEEQAHWDDLQVALFSTGVPVETVAVATVFTTGHPTREMEDLSWQIREHLGGQVLDQTLVLSDENQFFQRWEGRVFLPIWQRGERPYASEGGGFEQDEDGHFILQAWERVAFSLSLPQRGEEPPDGYPLVISAHGTGGDHQSCCETSELLSPAAIAAQANMAVFSVSQPLHGDRGTPDTIIDLHTFNFLNPESGRSSFRQGALDLVYLAEVLSAGPVEFEVDGRTVKIDTSKMTFLGHSQGGITGAIALPYIGDHINGAVLSGAGGGLSLSLVYRKQGGLDLEELVSSTLNFDSDEVLDPLHPVAGMVQTLTEVTDSLNYAPDWFANEGGLPTRPVPVLMFEGLLDEHTPPITTEALSAAGRVPVLDPPARWPENHQILGLDPQPVPAEKDLVGYDGNPVTGGLMQYADQNHFAIFNIREAADLYQAFLVSAVEGEPVIGD